MQTMDSFENWMTQVRKGILELCILNALAEGECYGYDLVRKLRGVPGLDVAEGTLYPLLSRLRMQGLVRTRLVESTEGPARKYYALTGDGRRNLGLMNGYLKRLVEGSLSLKGKEES